MHEMQKLKSQKLHFYMLLYWQFISSHCNHGSVAFRNTEESHVSLSVPDLVKYTIFCLLSLEPMQGRQ